MKKMHQEKPLRWVIAAIVVFNTVFNYLSNYLPFGQSIPGITAQYHTLFMPAGYAFSIWGLIYVSFIVYAVYQLIPAQRDKLLYDELAIPFILVNLLAGTWIIAFRLGYIGLSVYIIAAMLYIGIALCRHIRHARIHHPYPAWIIFPFTLFSGWITVACIVNVNTWLATMEWNGGVLGETSWTMILIGIAVLAAIAACIYYKELAYPLVVSWALIAIWVADRFVNQQVAVTALIAAIVLPCWAIAYLVRIHYQKSLPCYSGRCVMKVL